jgi:D-alanyl-D-alanine carboxypeptidase (penicillin-binding protein 5/6)
MSVFMSLLLQCGISVALLFGLLFRPAYAQATTVPAIAARAWLLVDPASGQALAAEKADEQIEPASLTKLMTAYLVFAALRDKGLSLSQVVPVSEKAWRAGGSKMFIEPRKPVTVDELITGMIVQSGNDACIALAEVVAGTEDNFAQLMNREAQRLGMKNSSFTNASGLPDSKHFSTARDLGLLASALIRDFPQEYEKYYRIKEYRYNNITQRNRNRLLWLDPNVDGVKTGHTENAGYCLIASAKRGQRRLVSVVLGTSSDSVRAQEAQKLLNVGFQQWDTVRLYEKSKPVGQLEVWKGASRLLTTGVAQDLNLSVPKGQAERVRADLVSQQPLVAPIAAGQRVGTIRVTLDDKPLAEFPAIAMESVAAAGMFGRAWDSMRLWFK